MADEQDKIVQHPEEEIPMAQSDEAGPPKPPTQKQIAESLNDTHERLKRLKGEITTTFVEKASREDLHAKELELKTIVDLYKLEWPKLILTQMTEANRIAWSNQKTYIEKTEKQLQQLFNTSKYNIASNKVAILNATFVRLENEKQELTDEFLKKATKEILQEKRSKHEEIKEEYFDEFENLKIENLTETEKQHIQKQKQEAERLNQEIKNLISIYLDEKTVIQIEPIVGQAKENVEQLEALQSAHQRNMDAMQKRLENAEKINEDLERKLKSAREPNDDPPDDNNSDQIEGTKRTVNPTMVQYKFDQMKLLHFSGDLSEWVAFKAVFTDMVHNQAGVTDVNKFVLLRNHLHGVAFDTIKGYLLIGANYQSAWADLLNRFDRKEDIAEEYLKRFYAVSAILQKPNNVNLRRIIDATNQMLHGLNGIQMTIANWDPMVNFIIKTKLDDQTRSEWRQHVGRKLTTTTKELLEFLETKAIELLPSQSEKLSQIMKSGERKFPQKKVIFQVNESKQNKEKKLECLICHKNHHVWNCYMLKKECAKVRTNMIKSLGLCFKCLVKHKVGMCDSDDCEYCGGPHNVLLCFKKENDSNNGAIRKTQNYQPIKDAISGNSISKEENNGQVKKGYKSKWPGYVINNDNDEDWNKPSTSKN